MLWKNVSQVDFFLWIDLSGRQCDDDEKRFFCKDLLLAGAALAPLGAAGWLVQLCIGWQTSHLAQGSNLLKENFLKQQNSNLKITAAFGGRGTATLDLF